jgi:hypothetical protein
VADLGDIGLRVPATGVMRAGNAFTIFRLSGMTVEIDPAPLGAIIDLSVMGVAADKRMTSSDGVCRFYDLEPGVYAANVVYGGDFAWSWEIVVTLSDYTVTPIFSVFGGEPSYVSIG